MTTVKRTEWGANDSISKAESLNDRNIPVKYLFIHHTAADRCFKKQDCIKRVKEVETYHLSKGFDDIGYNYLVGEDGNIYEGRGWRKVGAHTYGYNKISIAICVLGNFVDKSPKTTAINATKCLIKDALFDGILSEDFEMFGHMDVGRTLSPGQKLYDNITLFPQFSTKVMQKYDGQKQERIDLRKFKYVIFSTLCKIHTINKSAFVHLVKLPCWD